MPPTTALHTGAALCDDEEVMEQEVLEGERECSEYTKEVDLPVSSPWSSTDNDRHTEEVGSPVSSPQNSTDSDRQMEEEDEAELSDEPTGEPADGPTDETAVKLVEGHPPNDELAEGDPPNVELTKDHPPDDELTEAITVKCPPSGQESPPGSAWEEDRVVVHASEDEMDCLC